MSASTRLHVRVSPGAARTRVVSRHGDGWKVSVAAPPEDGRANEAVVGLLAETAGVPRRAVEVVSGRSGRDKTVTLAGIGPNETERCLARACGDGKDNE